MAAVDYYLKIEGIKGESKDKTHKDEIEIQSFSWGAVQSGSASQGGGMGSGRVQMHDFNFTKTFDVGSSKTFLACATGEHKASAVLTCRKAGSEQQEFLVVTFTDILISSYNLTGGDSPMEQISFNFSKVQMAYKEQKQDGTLGGAVTASYDIKQQIAG